MSGAASAAVPALSIDTAAPGARDGHGAGPGFLAAIWARIWHVEGSVALAPGQSGDDAFERLDPLFRQAGTSRERTGDTLTFRKKDPVAQDKMAVFDGGVLRIETGEAGTVLRYRLASRALLFCFLAPLLFLVFAQSTIILAKLDPPAAKAKPEAKKTPAPLNPIDKALGAPEPEQPKKGADKDDDKPSPTPGYIFAGLFATLYVIGRIVEGRRIRALFEKSLMQA